MSCIGNDVVDWKHPANVQKSRESRYLKKILTNAEIEYVRDAQNPDVALWSLWAAKETAYKVIRKSSAATSFLPRRWQVNTPEIKHIKCHAGLDPASSPILDSRSCDLQVIRGNDGLDNHPVTYRDGKVIIPGDKSVFVRLFFGESYVHCIGSDNLTDLDKIIWGVDPVPQAGISEIADPSLFVRERLTRRLADSYDLNYRDIEIRRAKKGGELQPPCIFIDHKKAPFDISLSHDGQFVAYAFLPRCRKPPTPAGGAPPMEKL